MIAVDKVEKLTHLKFLISQLWQGQVTVALDYLRTQVRVRNPEKWSELIGYLEKHQSEIIITIDVALLVKLLAVGGWKGCRPTVGRRQKKKAMSWRPKGSKALSLLR